MDELPLSVTVVPAALMTTSSESPGTAPPDQFCGLFHCPSPAAPVQDTPAKSTKTVPLPVRLPFAVSATEMVWVPMANKVALYVPAPKDKGLLEGSVAELSEL